MNRKQVAIGVDIGGTKIRTGIVDAQGVVYGEPRSIATCADMPGEQIVQRLITLIKETLSHAYEYEVLGVGVGCTGPLNLKTGMLLEVENLPTLNNYPLQQVLEEALQIKVKMENDANALILAEALWGAGKDADTVLGFTLGTGIGCALIEHGKVWQGKNDCAGEIWTAPYRDGILEEYVSGNAVTRLYELHTGKHLSGNEIAALAIAGEEAAKQVWDDFAQALAYALSWTVNMLDPHVVVIGGSIIKSANLFWEQADTSFRRYVCRSVADSVSLKPAALGDNAGFIGAAALFFNER